MSHRSEYGDLRFCPKCGVGTLQRDWFPKESCDELRGHKMPKSGCEYVCQTCGFGFLVSKSRRVFAADVLHRQHRALRGNVKFTEKCVGKEVADAYSAALRGESEP